MLGGGAGAFAWKRDKDAREDRAAGLIQSALREAREHEGEQNWAAAVAAARKAIDIARSEDVDASEAQRQHARLRRERDAADEAARIAAANRRLLEDLEKARALERQHDGIETKDEAFSAAILTRWPDGTPDIAQLATPAAHRPVPGPPCGPS